MHVCTHCRIVLRETESLCPRDGHSGHEVTFPPLPEKLLERFAKAEPFAAGGTGHLWSVEDSHTGKRGLLKLLRDDIGYETTDKQRLRREWTKQAALDHAHLASVLDSGECNGQPWSLRAWVEGVSLAAHIAEQPLTRQQALSVAGQVAEAVDALHRAGMLHRDLKPGHIVVEPGEMGALTATVIDVGCPAPHLGPGGERVWGEAAYLAPEQGRGALVSFRSDLYALGAVLSELLTGAPPFVADDPHEVARMHREVEPALPSDLEPDVEKLLSSMLAKDPQHRPFSAQKVRKALAAYVALPEASRAPERASAQPVPSGRSMPPPPPPSVKPGRAGIPQPRVSAPPPVPGSVRAAKPRASQPPPVPGQAGRSVPPPPPTRADATQPVEIEQIVAVNEHFGRAEPAADATQPIDIGQILSVNEQLQEAKAPPVEPAKDATQPIDIGQILSVNEQLAESKADATPEELESETQAAQNETGTPLAAGQDTTEDSVVTAPVVQVAETADSLRSEATQQVDLDELLDDASPTPEEALAPADPAVPAEESPHLQSAHAAAPDAHPAPEEAAAPATEAAPPEPAYDSAADALDDEATQQVEAPAANTQDGAAVARDVPLEDDGPAQAPDFAGALAGPDVEEEASEDDEPTSVINRDHLVPMASAKKTLLGMQKPSPAPQQLSGWDADEESATPSAPAASIPTEAAAPPASDDAHEPTHVMRNPLEERKREQRTRFALLGAAAVLLLGSLSWALGRDDGPPESQPAARATTEPTTPAPAAAAPAPTVEPIVEPMAAKKTQPDEAPVAPQAEAPTEPEAGATGASEAETREEAPKVARREAKEAAPARKRARRAEETPEVDEEAWEAALSAARAAFKQRDYGKAARAYEAAVKANPGHAGTYAGLGAARLAQGNPRGAARAYRHAVRISPRTSGFHAALGRAYAEAGNEARAKAQYRKALRLDRSNGTAKAGLAQL